MLVAELPSVVGSECEETFDDGATRLAELTTENADTATLKRPGFSYLLVL